MPKVHCTDGLWLDALACLGLPPQKRMLVFGPSQASCLLGVFLSGLFDKVESC